MDLLLRQTTSRLKFACVMAAYSFGTSGLLALALSALGLLAGEGPFADLPEDYNRLILASAVLFCSPALESLGLVALIVLTSFLTKRVWVQIVVPTIIWCVLHSLTYAPWGVIVAPQFIAGSYAYIRWRPQSFFGALGTTILIHVLHNLVPTVAIVLMN